ncbi:zinc ion binding [Cladochytrium tenue]|nr:zinc ion binding [Cladochytrium tenue]
MKTWKYSTFTGKLEDALVRDDDAPEPSKTSLGANQIIVEVITAGLNPVDYKLPEAGWIGRAMIKRPATPGLDYCGRITAKHPSNQSLEVGQVVFGGLQIAGQFGTTGQFVLASASECAPLPEGVDPDQAAAVGTAATTAYQSVVVAQVGAGSKVIINGGSGGVGTWAIQMAKLRGAAEVVTTCSGANAALCRQLGADEVIDYKETDLVRVLTEKGQVFDVAIDNVGSAEFYNARAAFLKPGGWFVQVGTPPLTAGSVLTDLTRNFWPTFLNPGRRRYCFVQQNNSKEYLEQIGKWIAEGKIRPVIDEKFAWEDVPAALSKLRQGHAKGKILVQVSK